MSGERGRCFENAARALANEPDDTPLRVAHGIVQGRGALEGIEFSHAWLYDSERDVCYEVGALPYAKGITPPLPALFYHQLGNIRNVTLYSLTPLLVELCRAEHYGPWEPIYNEYADGVAI